jgi:hypothetical protein
MILQQRLQYRVLYGRFPLFAVICAGEKMLAVIACIIIILTSRAVGFLCFNLIANSDCLAMSYGLFVFLAFFVAAQCEVTVLTEEDFATKTATGNWFIKFYGMLFHLLALTSTSSLVRAL